MRVKFLKKKYILVLLLLILISLVAYGIMNLVSNKIKNNNNLKVDTVKVNERNEQLEELKNMEKDKNINKTLKQYIKQQNINLTEWGEAIKNYNDVIMQDVYANQENEKKYIEACKNVIDIAKKIQGINAPTDFEVQDLFKKAMDSYILEMDIRIELITIYKSNDLKKFTEVSLKAKDANTKGYQAFQTAITNYKKIGNN